MKTQQTKEEIKLKILETVAKEKPENLEKLRQFMQQEHCIKPELTTQILIELQNEGKLHFKKHEPTTHPSISEYIFSKRALWYWIIITLSITTSLSVFALPEANYPLTYLRIALGILFVFFLPGFTFIKVLFPKGVPLKTASENLDKIELVALSLGLSLALTPIVGLILNYTPWGITLTTITLSLLGLTVTFASVALLSEYKTKTIQTNERSLIDV